MSTTLTNGLKLPDKGSVDWYADMQSNYAILDGAVGTIAEHTTALSGKAPAVHTHTKSDVTDLFNSANTWSGDNTYSKTVAIERSTDTGNFLALKNTVAELGSTPASATPVTIAYRDKNDENLGYMGVFYDTDGSNNFRLFVRNKFTSGAPSTSGAADYAYFGLKINADKSKEGVLRGTFRPYDNNTYDLGSSSYQWNNLYAKNYYYNGIEFQNKFVTLDTSQTISGLKYFSSNILHKTPQTIDVSTNPAEVITGKGLQFVDNAQYWGDITPQWTTDGTFRIRIAMTNYNTSGTSTGWFCPLVLDLAKDGSKIDVWSTHPNSNLGTSTNKWKTLNGINPGALSLPNINYTDTSKYVDISGGLSTTGSDNWYTPAVDGWIFMIINNSPTFANILVFVTPNGTTPAKFIAGAGGVLESSTNAMWCGCPAPAGSRVRIRIENGTIEQAVFVTCQGNV